MRESCGVASVYWLSPLSPARLALFGTVMEEEAQAVVRGWRQAAHTGEPVNVSAWMHRLTFRVVGRALLGLAPETLDELGKQLQTVGQQLFPYLAAPLQRTWLLQAGCPPLVGSVFAVL